MKNACVFLSLEIRLTASFIWRTAKPLKVALLKERIKNFPPKAVEFFPYAGKQVTLLYSSERWHFAIVTYASSGNLARGSKENSCLIQNSPYLIINKCSIYYTNAPSGKCPPLSVKLHKNILARDYHRACYKICKASPLPKSVYGPFF